MSRSLLNGERGALKIMAIVGQYLISLIEIWFIPCKIRCDNCKGSFRDISTRMDEFKDRLFINGWERTKAVWTVPQGFGDETFVACFCS